MKTRNEKIVFDDKPVLTSTEAAAFLGIAVSYIYKLTHWKKIPFSKPNGGKIYFRRDELESWMNSGRYLTVDEARADAIKGSRV